MNVNQTSSLQHFTLLSVCSVKSSRGKARPPDRHALLPQLILFGPITSALSVHLPVTTCDLTSCLICNLNAARQQCASTVCVVQTRVSFVRYQKYGVVDTP